MLAGNDAVLSVTIASPRWRRPGRASASSRPGPAAGLRTVPSRAWLWGLAVDERRPPRRVQQDGAHQERHGKHHGDENGH